MSLDLSSLRSSPDKTGEGVNESARRPLANARGSVTSFNRTRLQPSRDRVPGALWAGRGAVIDPFTPSGVMSHSAAWPQRKHEIVA